LIAASRPPTVFAKGSIGLAIKKHSGSRRSSIARNILSLKIEVDAMLRRARPEDRAAVGAIVQAAYSVYIERIGKPPGPRIHDQTALTQLTAHRPQVRQASQNEPPQALPDGFRAPNSGCAEREFVEPIAVRCCEPHSLNEGPPMRIAALSLVGAVCLAASAVAANAAPVAPSPAGQPGSNIVQVAGGCGWSFHPNRWGRCVPNRYGYYRARPHWPGYYGGGYGGGFGASPSDHVANQLNRDVLRRNYYGY
jgi:hypothetical protein